MSNVAVTNQSGLQGGEVINAASGTQSGTWVGVQVINDTIFDTLECNLDSSATLIGPTVPAGVTIFGRVTSIRISGAGIVIAYNSSSG